MVWIISENKEDFSGLYNELTLKGYAILYFNKISEALNYLTKETPEAILIDANHAAFLCFEFCNRIKSASLLRRIKLIVLSYNTSDALEEAMFDAGADEFVHMPLRVKPFVKRLLVRINSSDQDLQILKASKGKSSLQIDKESFSVYLNQNLVQLSRKEFELLHLIASQPGKVFTREEIFNKVWKRNHVSKERTIDVHILRLRKKLGEEFISTQKGVGYRFCA